MHGIDGGMLAKEPAGALYGWGFRNQLNAASSDAKAVLDGDACQAARIPILFYGNLRGRHATSSDQFALRNRCRRGDESTRVFTAWRVEK